MNDITTLDAEGKDLQLHVDLCAQRYNLLEKRLNILELKVDRLSEEILKFRKSTTTTVVTAAATVVASVIGLIITIFMKL